MRDAAAGGVRGEPSDQPGGQGHRHGANRDDQEETSDIPLMSPQDQRVAPAIGSFEREPKPGTQQPYGGAGERRQQRRHQHVAVPVSWLADTLPCALHQIPLVAVMGACGASPVLSWPIRRFASISVE